MLILLAQFGSSDSSNSLENYCEMPSVLVMEPFSYNVGRYLK